MHDSMHDADDRFTKPFGHVPLPLRSPDQARTVVIRNLGGTPLAPLQSIAIDGRELHGVHDVRVHITHDRRPRVELRTWWAIDMDALVGLGVVAVHEEGETYRRGRIRWVTAFAWGTFVGSMAMWTVLSLTGRL
jgi:hypothetical protein